jgi:hypothetical protein
MWGQNWGQMIWTAIVRAPAVGFWGVVLLGGVLGLIAVLSQRRTRPRVVSAIVLVLALAIPISARAGVPFVFANGTIADATQINADFTAVSVVTANGVSHSAGATKFCGSTATLTAGTLSSGGLTGYRAAKALCQAAASCGTSATAHMCTGDEMLRSAQIGDVPSGVGWFSTAMGAVGAAADCAGWTTSSSSATAPAYVGSGQFGAASCNTLFAILCCD